MCDNCDDLIIPTGETGATGATGLTGATGAAGANGTNGTSGTTILSTYNSFTGVGTPASTVETTLFTYNVPANTLSTNGDELELYAFINYSFPDIVTLRFKFGAKIVTIFAQDTVSDVRLIRIKISRISATSQLWTIEYNINILPTAPQVNLLIDSSTVDLSTILAFEISAQNTTAVANQVVLKKATLYKYDI